MYVILYYDPNIFVFSSWPTSSHISTNGIFQFSHPVSFKEIGCFKMPQDALKS